MISASITGMPASACSGYRRRNGTATSAITQTIAAIDNCTPSLPPDDRTFIHEFSGLVGITDMLARETVLCSSLEDAKEIEAGIRRQRD